MLHITNGDSAAKMILSTGIQGEILPWRDVLHEGPVPQGLALAELSKVRAEYIASQRWGTYDDVLAQFRQRDLALAEAHDHDEVVLWFEHDLYDQLHVLQVLDWFSVRGRLLTRLKMACGEEYLGTVDATRGRELFAMRLDVSDEELRAASAAWAAFRSPQPLLLQRLVDGGTSVLPYVTKALRRHLEQFPAVGTGLSRSERQALAAVARGRQTVGDAFLASSQEVEEAVFLGDAVFFAYLEALSDGDTPLLVGESGSRIRTPDDDAELHAFIGQTLSITDLGRAVLNGDADWLEYRPIDKWLGGVHLTGHRPEWRWNAEDGRIVRETD